MIAPLDEHELFAIPLADEHLGEVRGGYVPSDEYLDIDGRR